MNSGTRFAVAAGTLTTASLDARLAEAARTGQDPLAVFSEAELLHLRLIQKTLAPGATWEDAAAMIRQAGRRQP